MQKTPCCHLANIFACEHVVDFQIDFSYFISRWFNYLGSPFSINGYEAVHKVKVSFEIYIGLADRKATTCI